MTNFVIKDDIFFTLEKSEGNMDFPRKFLAKKVSGTEIKIRTLGSNEALLVDVWHLDNFTIDGASFTDVHEAITALQPILWNEASGESEPPIDYTAFFEELIELAKTDESYQLFEDTDGNVLFGKLDEDGVIKYIRPDGSEYTGDVKPYSRELKQTITDYCADSIPYSLIQLRDADTKQVVASIWRNDNDLTESNTAPANATKGGCVVADLTGTDCDNAVFTKDCDRQELLDKLDELIDATEAGNIDYTALLTSIDTKLGTLENIKTELETANNTLTSIESNTTEANSKLDTLIENTQTQIDELILIKDKIEEGNTSLAELVTLTTNIDANITTIKDDVALIKTSVESIDAKLDDVITSLENIETLITESNTLLTDILAELDVELIVNTFEKNNGTINYYQRDTIQWDSETGTEISSVTEYSIDGITWTTTAPDGDVNLGFLPHGADTFQVTDCESNEVGEEQDVLKTVVLNKQTAKICNTADITDPIVEAIENIAPTPVVGKKQDLLTWVAEAGDTITIPTGKFSTISLIASKGEFKIENTNNDYSLDFIVVGGTLETFIEISSDGTGTESGATDLPNTIDTRANSNDMNPLQNSYLITCVREGVLTIEIYK
jgi:hypothetical protein